MNSFGLCGNYPSRIKRRRASSVARPWSEVAISWVCSEDRRMWLSSDWLTESSPIYNICLN